MQIILGDTLVNGEESKYHRSQSSKPPTRVSLSTPPPTAERGRLRSFGEPGDVASKVTQPIISITRAAPTSVTEANTREIAHPPAVSLGGAAAPATSALAQSAFASRTLSRSRSPAEFSERAGGHKLDGEGAFTPAAAWWGKSNRQRTNPIEQAEGYTYTRSRVIEAVGGALGTDASFGHEALFAGVDLLQFSPVPGLITAGTVLLNIWDAIENVQTNRQASLRLTERCASILISIRHEIVDTTGYTVPEELGRPIAKIVDAFEEVRLFLDKLGKRPFLKRYLGRNETLSCIAACDSSLRDAFDMLNHSIQIRTLRLIQVNEQRKQKDSETHDLFESVSHVYPGLPPADPTSLPAALHSSPAYPESVRNTLHALRASQNEQDRSYNMADLHQLMRAALAANDDVAMLEVLQIARSEMPEAVKTLERLVEDGELNTEESTTALPSQHEKIGKADDFPSWEIARFEIDLEAKVGIGRFSDVYRGTWRKHTVAVKMLSETTPREAFLREVGIWKFLHLDHPNVLEVFGASSASGDPPWFLVSKYYPRGNLVKYLKGLSDADAAGVEALKMIYEISKGMAYLHKQGVLHGDLKASNILVDDDTRCVISDFGQSEMKSGSVASPAYRSHVRGTLRWQAPELMEGAQALTQEMDVYAFAICCWEILMMGSLPWPFLDDDSVRHSILNENMRPSIPPSNLVNDQLMNVIRASWDRSPSNRPSFEQIARQLRKQLGAEHS
ncbi:Protein kinase-like domain containing protein [Lactarius tabidus]